MAALLRMTCVRHASAPPEKTHLSESGRPILRGSAMYLGVPRLSRDFFVVHIGEHERLNEDIICAVEGLSQHTSDEVSIVRIGCGEGGRERGEGEHVVQCRVARRRGPRPWSERAGGFVLTTDHPETYLPLFLVASFQVVCSLLVSILALGFWDSPPFVSFLEAQRYLGAAAVNSTVSPIWCDGSAVSLAEPTRALEDRVLEARNTSQSFACATRLRARGCWLLHTHAPDLHCRRDRVQHCQPCSLRGCETNRDWLWTCGRSYHPSSHSTGAAQMCRSSSKPNLGQSSARTGEALVGRCAGEAERRLG